MGKYEIVIQTVLTKGLDRNSEYLETLSKNANIDFVGKDINPNEITNLGLLEKIDE